MPWTNPKLIPKSIKSRLVWIRGVITGRCDEITGSGWGDPTDLRAAGIEASYLRSSIGRRLEREKAALGSGIFAYRPLGVVIVTILTKRKMKGQNGSNSEAALVAQKKPYGLKRDWCEYSPYGDGR